MLLELSYFKDWSTTEDSSQIVQFSSTSSGRVQRRSLAPKQEFMVLLAQGSCLHRVFVVCLVFFFLFFSFFFLHSGVSVCSSEAHFPNEKPL